VHNVQQTDSNLAGQGNQLQPAKPIVVDVLAGVVMGIADPVICIPEVTKKPQKQHR